MTRRGISIHDMGPCAQWEFDAGFARPPIAGHEAWYAEIGDNGRKYTVYFDVTPEEVKRPMDLKKWIIDNWKAGWKSE